MCRIFSSFLISLVNAFSSSCLHSILAVAEAIADHEWGRCGNTDPYTDVSLPVSRGKILLSYLFLYQQIKLFSKTWSMSRGAVCDGVMQEQHTSTWLLASLELGWRALRVQGVLLHPLCFLSINRAQLLLPGCHWLAWRVFWQLYPWDKRDLTHLAVRSVVLWLHLAQNSCRGVVGSGKSSPASCGIFWGLLKIHVFKPSLEKHCFYIFEDWNRF